MRSVGPDKWSFSKILATAYHSRISEYEHLLITTTGELNPPLLHPGLDFHTSRPDFCMAVDVL